MNIEELFLFAFVPGSLALAAILSFKFRNRVAGLLLLFLSVVFLISFGTMFLAANYCQGNIHVGYQACPLLDEAGAERLFMIHAVSIHAFVYGAAPMIMGLCIWNYMLRPKKT